MTTYYVDSASGSNSNAGTSSSAPKQYLKLDSGGNSLHTDGLVSGDIIYIKSGHSETLADADQALELGGMELYVVDSLTSPTAFGAKGSALIGHSTPAGNARHIVITMTGGAGIQRGIHWRAGEFFSLAASTGTIANRFIDCIIEGMNDGDTMTLSGQSSFNVFENCDLLGDDAPVLVGRMSSQIVFYGCKFARETGDANPMRGLHVANENGFLEFYGCDLSDLLRLFNAINAEIGGLAGRFIRCKLPSTVRPATWVSEQSFVEFYNCHTADSYFAFQSEHYHGTIKFDSSVYRDATYDGVNGYSVLMNSNANATKSQPLRHMIAEIPSVDLTTAKTVTVEIIQTVSEPSAPTPLQNDEFYIMVESTDPTDLALAKIFKSTETMAFETPADLTTSTETWTALTYQTKQKVSVDLDAVTGADDVPLRVWAFAGRNGSSLNINICPNISITAT